MGLFKKIGNFFKGALSKGWNAIKKVGSTIGKGVLSVGNFIKPLIKPIGAALSLKFPGAGTIAEGVEKAIEVGNNIKNTLDNKNMNIQDKIRNIGWEGYAGYKNLANDIKSGRMENRAILLSNQNADNRSLNNIGYGFI